MSEDREDKTEIYLPDRKPRAEPSGIPGDSGAPPKARLVCTDASELDEGHSSLEIALSTHEVTVGRSKGNTVTVPSTQLSRVHARIYPGPGRWGIEDMDSKNGVWVNDAEIKQCWLKPGDVVKLGPIPFRYDLDRPETDSQDATAMGFTDTMITDKTMLVGSDVRAASSLLRAVKKRDEDPGAEATAPSATETRTRSETRPAAAPAKAAGGSSRAAPAASANSGKSKLVPIVGGIVALLVVAVGGYSVLGGAGERDAVKQFSGNIKSFITDAEHSNAEHSDKRALEEIATLSGYADAAKAASDKYSGSAALRAVAAELAFLKFERDFDIALRANAVEKARTLITDNTAELARLSAGVKATPESQETFDSIGGLYRLASAALELHAFQLKYPNPDDTSAPRPSAGDLTAMGKDLDDFAQEKRKNNLPLSVRYRYMLKIIKDVEDNDLRVLNRWREVH